MLKDVQFYRRLSISVVIAVLLLFTFTSGVAGASRNAAQQFVGPKTTYLALGDSLAFGYQPNGDYTHGYVPDFFQDLQKHGVKNVVNLGCSGETSFTMYLGFCPKAPKGSIPQLAAAVKYLNSHPGHVSPVTLDIGANDVLHDFDPKTCTVNEAAFYTNLAILDADLKVVILPSLHKALTVNGKVAGDLLIMNYYDPFQNICPKLIPYAQTLNKHLADDARGYGTIVDVFSAFGGAGTPNPKLCDYTWMCGANPDIHATNKGYEVIAGAFEETAGY